MFTITARDREGQCVGRGGSVFEVEVGGGGEVRGVEDRGDGTHVVRYCVEGREPRTRTVAVRHKGTHIRESPSRVRVAAEIEGRLVRQFGIGLGPGYHVAVHGDLVLVAGASRCCVRVFTKAGGHVRNIGTEGTGDAQFKAIYGVTVSRAGEVRCIRSRMPVAISPLPLFQVFVSDYDNECRCSHWMAASFASSPSHRDRWGCH